MKQICIIIVRFVSGIVYSQPVVRHVCKQILYLLDRFYKKSVGCQFCFMYNRSRISFSSFTFACALYLILSAYTSRYMCSNYVCKAYALSSFKALSLLTQHDRCLLTYHCEDPCTLWVYCLCIQWLLLQFLRYTSTKNNILASKLFVQIHMRQTFRCSRGCNRTEPDYLQHCVLYRQ